MVLLTLFRNRSRLKAHHFLIVGPSVVAKLAKTFGESETPKLLASFATNNQPVNGHTCSFQACLLIDMCPGFAPIAGSHSTPDLHVDFLSDETDVSVGVAHVGASRMQAGKTQLFVVYR